MPESSQSPRLAPIRRSWNPALPHYATAEEFTERERAALRYVEEINTARAAADQTFEALQQHFSEQEIVELTWLNAVGNYLNLQTKPLGIGSEGFCSVPTS